MIGEILEFWQTRKRAEWPALQLAAFRRQKLHQLIHHAYTNVPYYRDLLQKANVQPGDIADFPDLIRIPVTTKAMLRDAGDRALATGSCNLLSQHTSGHSGVPFIVRYSQQEQQSRRLREFRMLISVGVRPRDQLILLGPTRSRPQRLHRWLGLYRMEVIPCTLTHQELSARFEATRPDVLWVYPTSLKTVLYHTGKTLHQLVQPRIMITSAQVMDAPFRQRLLAESPGLEIVDIYGSSEVGRIAAVCEHRTGLHVEEDALHVELLASGQPVSPGESGSVTITALDQLAMPFIRYEQGDLCRQKLEPCSCGRNTALLYPPIGRNPDMITLPSGQKVSCAIVDVALRDETELLQYRFVQTSLSTIRAELFYRLPPSTQHLEHLRKLLTACTNGQIDYNIEVLSDFRMEGAKFKVFVSELPGPLQ